VDVRCLAVYQSGLFYDKRKVDGGVNLSQQVILRHQILDVDQFNTVLRMGVGLKHTILFD
jgi:hypothetical protein